MIRDIDPIEEIRKHPGITAGSLAVHKQSYTRKTPARTQ